jgi:hypothetical protein
MVILMNQNRHPYWDLDETPDPTSSLAVVDPLARLAAAIVVRAILDLHSSKSSWLTVVDCLYFFLKPDGAGFFLEVIGLKMDPIDLLTCVINGDIAYAGSSYYLIRRDEGSHNQPEANIYGQTTGRSCARLPGTAHP